MLFSIIVPIYKVERYIRECIESVLSQDFEDYELILVDDGSPDSCPRICDEYASKDSRIKVIHKENGGVTSARKAGAEIAKGDYILALDSDDTLDKEALQYLSAIVLTEEVDMVTFGYRKFGSKTKYKVAETTGIQGLYSGEKLKTLIVDKFLFDERKPWINNGSLSFSACTKLVRKEIFVPNQISISNSIVYGEDCLLVLKCLYSINSIYVSDKTFYNYRMQSNSVNHYFNEKIFHNLNNTLNEIINETGMENRVKVWALTQTLYQICSVAVKSDSYRLFSRRIKMLISESEVHNGLWKISKEAIVETTSIANRICIFFFKHQILLPLYIVFKYLLKGCF